MTKPTPHGQVPEALIDLIDAYAETRHRYGRIYNAKTEAARNAVIEALSEVQALSAAPVVPRMSAAEVNTLPAHVRSYIHQLASLCDPAGLVRENVQLLDTNNALQKMYRRAADACAEVFGCFAAGESEGLKGALSDATDERLKDLVERRLMYAMHAVRDIAASPTAEQQAQPGAVGRTGCTAGTDEECTRRGCATSCPAQQAAPKAAPGEPSAHQILAITTAYEQGVGKGHQAYKSGKGIANPYDSAYGCDLAWQYGYREGKEQAKQAAPKAAPGEQNTVPAEWLEQAYREGWAACRDAETIGEEAEDWAFGNSTANSRMIDAQQAAPQPSPNLPERDASLPAERQGLFRKFVVGRVDGSDKPGGKHHGCTYFVLDVDHDPCARPALAAYAAACESTHPTLAADLRTKWGVVPAPQPAPATQQAGDVVAYLDVGAGGYLDLGAALSEDALQQLPKGRHALVIAGTYGIDGYVAAPQPSPMAQAAEGVPAIQGEMNVQLDIDSNHSAPGQQRDVARSVALGQPMGNGQDQAAGRPSAQGDKLLTVAERNIRSFLRSAQFKVESDREAALNCVDVLWAAARDPADSVQEDDDIDAVALARYKVVPAHESMFHRFAVVAGDGKQQLYLGREVECENMARKFAGAFLDGAFYQANITPSTQAADSVQEDAARYRWLREGNDAKHGAAWHVAVNLYGCEWDSAIDAAIAAQGGK